MNIPGQQYIPPMPSQRSYTPANAGAYQAPQQDISAYAFQSQPRQQQQQGTPAFQNRGLAITVPQQPITAQAMAYNGVSEGRRGSQGSTGSAPEGDYYAEYNYGVSRSKGGRNSLRVANE